jgi:hypothetical protein
MSLHNFNRTTSPVCCEDSKELPNIIQGAEEEKMKDRRMVLFLFPFPSHVYIYIVFCLCYKQIELLKYVPQVYLVSSSESLHSLL